MAHNLYKDRMMYVGERPWHGLGKELMNPATSKEAIEVAGLDWEVGKFPVTTHPTDWSLREVPGAFATVNMETGKPLGVIGSGYQIYQNRDAFSFFDSIVGSGEAIYHTAGALGDGERVWLLAKLPKDLLLYREDVVEKYLCLTNSHDGTSSLKVYFTPIRVVCQNTLSMSMRDAGSGVSIRHMGDLQDKVKEARRVLGLALDFCK